MARCKMIAIFTDFGLSGPYVGQMQAAIWRSSIHLSVVNLFADAPAFRPMESAYLLAAHVDFFPKDTVFLCVVDPGVGSDRPGVALCLDGRWFVGPGNGLFEPLTRRATRVESYLTAAPTDQASASFHGRDIFAPLAAGLALGRSPQQLGLIPAAVPRFLDWPDDLAAVVYIDVYGNLMSGLRADSLTWETQLELGGAASASRQNLFRCGRGRSFLVSQFKWFGGNRGELRARRPDLRRLGRQSDQAVSMMIIWISSQCDKRLHLYWRGDSVVSTRQGAGAALLR